MAAGVVAIVDDNSSILDAFKLVLEINGYKALVYTSPTAFLNDQSARPDCLVLDQNMPGIFGLELAALLRSGGNRIPILLATGEASDAIAARAAGLGIEAVLEKPIQAKTFLKFVKAHC